MKFDEQLAIILLKNKCDDSKVVDNYKKVLEDIGYKTKILETIQLQLKCKTLNDTAVEEIKNELFNIEKISKVIIESNSDSIKKGEEFDIRIFVLKSSAGDFKNTTVKNGEKELVSCYLKENE